MSADNWPEGRWAFYDEEAPEGRKRVHVLLGGVEHVLLPTEALWLGRELINAASEGLTNARDVVAGAPLTQGFCGAQGKDGWYCSKRPGHVEPHAYTAARFIKRDAP